VVRRAERLGGAAELELRSWSKKQILQPQKTRLRHDKSATGFGAKRSGGEAGLVKSGGEPPHSKKRERRWPG
jgi:hypothetical protein